MNRKNSTRPWTPWCAAFLAFLLPAAMFLPSLSFDFVYDARYQILSGSFLHDPANWLSVLTLRVMSMDVLDFNRPVHLASLMLDAVLWGREPFGYHLTNILLHATNTLLVFFLALRLVSFRAPAADIDWKKTSAALAGALLFGLHPLQSEAVCEPTYREDLLATFFTLAALLTATGARGGMTRTESLARALLCATLCFLACGSKETGAAAFAILALWRFCFGNSGAPAWWGAPIAASFATTAIFLALRFSLEAQNSLVFEARPDFFGGSFLETLKNLPVLWSIHVRNFFNPSGLCADYGILSSRGLTPLEAWAGLSALALAAFLAALRSRRTAFCLGFTLLALLPASNLLPMYRPVADRYMYLPLAGLGLLLATIWSHPFRVAWTGTTLRAATALFLAAMATATWHRQFVWRDSRTLWTDTARKNPRSFNAWIGLAYDSQRLGRPADSKPYLLRANEIARGGDPEVWLALAIVLDAEGNSPQAKKALQKALALNPDLRNPEQRAARAVMEIHHARAVRQLLEKYPSL